MHENETLSVLMYFCNTFNEDECHKLWGDGIYGLGDHMYNKFASYSNSYGPFAAIPLFLLDLDSGNYQIVIDRACELYNGRKNLKNV